MTALNWETMDQAKTDVDGCLYRLSLSIQGGRANAAIARCCPDDDTQTSQGENGGFDREQVLDARGVDEQECYGKYEGDKKTNHCLGGDVLAGGGVLCTLSQ
jgi:hypothetical protein